MTSKTYIMQPFLRAIFLFAALTLCIHVKAQEVIVDDTEKSDNEVTYKFPADVEVEGQRFAMADSIVWDIPSGKFDAYDVWIERDVEFNPSPNRAVWMSALFPGLGQVYNRRYWKLPIIVGGYLGLAYATSWNNTMLTDYQRAYRDIMDNDPSTNSYMDFFPPTIQESDLDKTWLTNLLKSRKDFYRRNRDLCIIGMVGVYLLAMVDAYVDASLSHFDISPDLSLDLTPSLIQDTRNSLPGIAMTWALNF